MSAAIGAQLIALGALAAFAGLGGGGALGSPAGAWLDVLNNFVPFWFAAGLAGLLLLRAGLERRRARTVLTAIALATIVVTGAPIAGEYGAGAVEAVQPKGQGPRLRVLHFNVYRENYAPWVAIQTIRNSGADLVALHEAMGIRSLLSTLRDIYPYQTPCLDQYCSVVVMAKAKAKPERIGVSVLLGTSFGPVKFRGDGDVGIGRIDFTTPDGKPATLVTTHLRWPFPYWVRDRQELVLQTYLKTVPKDRLILTGDFNLTPWSFTMRAQDHALRPLRRLTRALPTYPSGLPRIPGHKPPFLPIDHVYAGPAWGLERVKRLGVAASDHFPVLVDLRAR